jgi:hypothetical protein
MQTPQPIYLNLRPPHPALSPKGERVSYEKGEREREKEKWEA